MSLADPDQVELFRWADQLPEALWDDLAARPPAEAAAATDAELSQGRFSLGLLGADYLVDPAARSVTLAARPDARVSFQAGLVLLTTLAQAQDLPASGVMITPGELPGGRQFFTGPHDLNTAALEKAFGRDPAGLARAARTLGGGPEEGLGADAAVRVPGLPRVPLWVLLWEGDEEFEPRAVMGIDQRAHFHLALDGVWALTNLLAARLTGGPPGAAPREEDRG
jgi:hypothetical protein